MVIVRTARPLAFAALLLVASAGAFAQAPTRQSVERFRSAVALAANGSLLVDNPIGHIQIVGTARPGLRWEAVKVVRGVDSEDVDDGRKMTLLQLDGGPSARVLRTVVSYPLRNGRWESNVGYRIEVPAATNVTVVNISSPLIRIRGVSGAVTVKNVSGRIELESLTGPLRVESVNGIVRAVLPERVENNASLSSVNGRVELAVPRGASFNWTAETARGGVHAAFNPSGFFREQDNTRRYYAAINGSKGPTVVTSSLLGDVYLLRPENTIMQAAAIAAPQGRTSPPPAARPMPLQPQALVAFRRVTETLLQRPTARSFAAQEPHVVGDYEVDASVGSIFIGQIDGNAEIATRAGEIVVGRVAGKGDLRSLGGSLHLGDIAGPVTARTSVGDIVIRTALQGGSANTDAGLIRIGRASGPLDLRSGGGDVIVHRAESAVEARTRSGDVFVAVPRGVPSARIEATTEDGNVALQVPPGFGAEIDAMVVTSHDGPNVISTDIRGLTIVREMVNGKTRIRATGKVGGGGQKVVLRANEGTIQIRMR